MMGKTAPCEATLPMFSARHRPLWQLGLLAIVLAPSQVVAQLPTLHDVDTSFFKKNYEDVTRPYVAEKIVSFRFEEDEPFLFRVPKSLLRPGRVNQLLSLGTQRYAFDHDSDSSTAPIIYSIPTKLLRIRATLLACHQYCKATAQQAGLPYQELSTVAVDIGYFGLNRRSTTGVTSRIALLRSFGIRLPQNLPSHTIENTAAHEYFHIAQWQILPSNLQLDGFTASSDEVSLEFLDDMTSEWFTDEPISIAPPIRGGLDSTDKANNWLIDRSYKLLKNPTDAKYFHSHRRYQAAILVKYLTEQLNGGQDAAGLKHVFALHASVYAKGKATQQTIWQSIGEMLPANRFKGTTWQQRLTQFKRDFEAANLVQKATSRNAPADRLGYRDDAFANLNDMHDVFVSQTWTEDSSRPPQTIYQQPAQSTAERQRRLAELAVGSGTAKYLSLSGMTSSWHLINLAGKPADSSSTSRPRPPRPLFVYVETDGDKSEVSLIEQHFPSGRHQDRQSSVFKRSSELTLWNEPTQKYVKKVTASWAGHVAR